MDARPQRLTVVVAPSARRDLDDIWGYNAAIYGIDHATSYLEFLQDQIQGLSSGPSAGRQVFDYPELRGLTVRRGKRGHGHIVIYRVDEAIETLGVLHVFHTAQDLSGRLRSLESGLDEG